MIQPLHTVLFDLDGTLMDSAEGITASMAYTFAAMGKPFDVSQAWRYIGPPLKVTFLSAFPGDEERAERMVDIYRAHNREHGLPMIKPFDGIPQLLRALKEEGIRMAVATSRAQQTALELLRTNGLGDYFDAVFGTSPYGNHVDKVLLMRQVVDSLELDVEGCVMVGDRCYDVDGAASVGMRSIAVGYGNGTPEELSGATYYAGDLQALRYLLLRDA